jgi:serine/threonine protein kinase
LDILHVSLHDSNTGSEDVGSSAGLNSDFTNDHIQSRLFAEPDTCISVCRDGIRSRSSLLLPQQLLHSVPYRSPPITPSIFNGDTFVMLGTRGEGYFGVISEVFHCQHNIFCALKKTRCEVTRVRQRDVCFREVDIMSKLRHCPFIVRYYDSWISEHFYIQMELCEGAFCTVTGRRFHSEEFMLRLLKHASCAFCTMHGLGIVHLDVKPNNIFMVTDPFSGLPTFKIGDFGTARWVHDIRDLEDGANIYMAGEILAGAVDARLIDRADVFSLGVMVYEALRGECITPECISKLRWSGVVPRFPAKISDKLFALLSQMMHVNPCLRPSARDISMLPWIGHTLESSPEQSQLPDLC